MRQGEIYVITHPFNQIPDDTACTTGLLGGMMGFPSSGWDKSTSRSKLIGGSGRCAKNPSTAEDSAIFLLISGLIWKFSYPGQRVLAAA